MSNENKEKIQKVNQIKKTTPTKITQPIKPKEIGGKDGPDPVRYGDWENNGIASDF
jgi:hypothetical protein